jgi:hypothetical protein
MANWRSFVVKTTQPDAVLAQTRCTVTPAGYVKRTMTMLASIAAAFERQ